VKSTLQTRRCRQLKIYAGAADGLPVTHMDRFNADLLEL
jgi:hypothetical protein